MRGLGEPAPAPEEAPKHHWANVENLGDLGVLKRISTNLVGAPLLQASRCDDPRQRHKCHGFENINAIYFLGATSDYQNLLGTAIPRLSEDI